MTFKFKQFEVAQDRCAMKVGTDGVLLGAWAPVDHQPYSVLDIGAGTGVLSLMIAQRCDAEQLDALEIEEQAFEQCTDNFENSKWADRLFCYHGSLDDFMDEPQDDYDLIISNPPFYTDDFKSDEAQRATARFEDSLPFEDLIEASALLLSEDGVLAVIIPFKEEERFVQLAQQEALYPLKITRVRGTADSPIKRSLLAFSKHKVEVTIDSLIIEIGRHHYTDEYISLTKEFYIKM